MTTPDMTLTTPAGEAPADIDATGGPEEPAPPVEERDDRRRKRLLLLFLLALLAILGSLSIWYLLFRKPITDIPVPIIQAPMPTYQYAFYDLNSPQGVAASADGSRIYVTQSSGSQETLMLDRQGATLGVLKPPVTTLDRARQLYLAVNPLNGQVWATDRYDGAVFVYDADGTYIRTFDPGATLDGWQPLGIGFDQQGNVYVADAGGQPQVVHMFSADGAFVRDIGATSKLDHPNGVAIDADGTVYVTDTANGRLVVFDNTGTQIGTVERGDAAGNLGLPVGIGFDDHGRILVADSSASMVQAYSPMAAGDRGPAYVNKFGEKGVNDGAFSFPNGLAVDGRGRVYVADWGNDRLEVWSY